ncbi:MAG: hypothetical protein EPO25_05005 [Gammaproteobacteria bacterium]|nr:MAG: hypothetical protein EPO25_05005 [Gammaproteobacteria bacterium]
MRSFLQGYLLMLAVLLAACMPQPAPEAAQPSDWRSPGKPQVPVELTVVGHPALHAGVPAEVLMEVRTGMPVDSIRVTIEGDAGLEVPSWEPRLLPAQDPQQVATVRVRLTAISGGLRRLVALLELDVGGQRIARPVAVTLAVAGPETALPGPPVAAQPRNAQETGEEGVVSMQAETRVR